MAKIKRETLKKFGCHEKQVEELMLELGHSVEDSIHKVELSRLRLETVMIGSTPVTKLFFGGVILLEFLSDGTVRRVPFIGLKTGFKIDDREELIIE